MNKPKLIIMVGIPGSGKSTFAQHYAEDANNMSTDIKNQIDICKLYL